MAQHQLVHSLGHEAINVTDNSAIWLARTARTDRAGQTVVWHALLPDPFSIFPKGVWARDYVATALSHQYSWYMWRGWSLQLLLGAVMDDHGVADVHLYIKIFQFDNYDD